MNEKIDFKKEFRKIISHENKLMGSYSVVETGLNGVKNIYGGYDNNKLYKNIIDGYCRLMPHVGDPASDEESAYFLYSYGVFMERYFNFDRAHELFQKVFIAGGAYSDGAAQQLAVLALRRGDEHEARRLCNLLNDKKKKMGYPESLLIEFKKIQESAEMGRDAGKL